MCRQSHHSSLCLSQRRGGWDRGSCVEREELESPGLVEEEEQQISV